MKIALLYLLLLLSSFASAQVTTDAAMKTEADYIGLHGFDPNRTKTLYYHLIDSKIHVSFFPSQTGNSLKFLTTNGTAVSWASNFTWDGANYRLNAGNSNSIAGNNEFNLGTGTAMSSLATESFSSCEACLVRASNTASFGKAITVGDNTNPFSGKNSLSSGIDNLNYGISSFVSGRGARVLYSATGITEGGFVHSFYGGALQSLEYVTASGGAGNMSSNTSAQTSGHGSLAKGGFIVGGEDANIPSTAINSFIGGGRLMKMISTDTSMAYFPNLRVRSGIGTGTRMMVFDALGHVGSQVISSGTVSSVSGTLPISVATGTTTPVISISQSNTSTNGYLSSTDWNTFNNKVSSQWVTTGSDIYYNTGNVMVGTNAAPSSKLQVVETSTATPRGVLVDQYNTGTQGARITMRKARGTFASPTVITTGDALASWTASGYDGANFIESGKIVSTSAGTIGTNIVPSKMDFQTANSSGTLTTGVSIDQAQALTFPAYTTNGGLHYSNGSGVLLQTGAGTSTTLLHGGTAPSYGAVALTTDVSGILAVVNGGTGSSTWPSWLLASGGALTAANTISSTTPSGLAYTNTWTATANNQFAISKVSTLASRSTASDAISAYNNTSVITANSTSIDNTGTIIDHNPKTTSGISAVQAGNSNVYITKTVAGMTVTTFTGVAPASTSGTGTGALFTVVVASATTFTSITQTTPGSGYSIGESVTFNGSQFGGSGAISLTVISTANSLSTNSSALRIINRMPDNPGVTKRLIDFQGSTGTSFGNINVSYSNASPVTQTFNMADATGTFISVNASQIGLTRPTTTGFGNGLTVSNATFTVTGGASVLGGNVSTTGTLFVGSTSITASTKVDIRGSGTTSSTNTLRLANSSNTVLSTVTDDGTASFLHIAGIGTAPGIAAGTGAGTSPTVSLTKATDLSGVINVTTGTLPTLSAAIVTITFATAYVSAPKVFIREANGNAATLSGVSMVFVDDANTTTTTFVLTAGATALTAATAYKWYYTVTQ